MENSSYLHYVLQSCTTSAVVEQLHHSSLLLPLWKNWNDVVGEPIISYIYPIGTKDTRLRVGTHDSSSFQEMHYYKDILLESVNTFLQQNFFTDVIVEYNTHAISLEKEANTVYTYEQKPPFIFTPPNVEQTILPHTSPVAKAYSAFLTLSSSIQK